MHNVWCIIDWLTSMYHPKMETGVPFADSFLASASEEAGRPGGGGK